METFYMLLTLSSFRGAHRGCGVFEPTAAMEERIRMSACAAKNGKRRDPVNAIRSVGAKAVRHNNRRSA